MVSIKLLLLLGEVHPISRAERSRRMRLSVLRLASDCDSSGKRLKVDSKSRSVCIDDDKGY